MEPPTEVPSEIFASRYKMREPLPGRRDLGIGDFFISIPSRVKRASDRLEARVSYAACPAYRSALRRRTGSIRKSGQITSMAFARVNDAAIDSGPMSALATLLS